MKRRTRGVTLLELMVGSGVALVVLAGAFALLLQSTALQRRQEELAAMKRSAAFVLEQLSTELRQAGLGRPRRARAEGSGELFPPPILLAEAQRLAFLTDLPRPNSSFNGISQLADDQSPLTLPTNGLALLNELNGSCDVSTLVLRCTTDAASLLFPAAAGTDCGDDAAARTCPWALNRYQPDEYLIIASPTGRWVERQLQKSGGALRIDTSLLGRKTVVLNAAIPAEFVTGTNRGFVSTPDRVFYQLNAGAVERNQCWGSMVGALAAGPATPCAADPDEGTGWERLATGFTATGLAFTYKNGAGADLPVPVPAAALGSIRQVDVELKLERTLPNGNVVNHATSLSITLRQ